MNLLYVALAAVLCASQVTAQDDAEQGPILGRVRTFERELESEKPMRSRKELGERVTQPQPQAAGKQWYQDEAALTSVLEAAEQEYKKNMRRRTKFLKLQEYNTEADIEHLRSIPVDGLFIPTYSCPLEVRIGAWLDGGKFLCVSHYLPKSDPVVLSIGCNGDSSFEEAISRRYGVVTSTVDFSLKPDVGERIKALDYLKLYEVGLYGTDSFYQDKLAKGVKWVNIFELLELVGETHVDIFKIDCEGCEYGVFADMRERYTRETVPFKQILVELHLPSIHISTFKALAALEGLGFRLFHSEINRFDEVYEHAHHELGFIHESIVAPRSESEDS